MTLSFSLSTSSESLSLVPGVTGELGSKNPALPGADGFSELLRSLASIVPAQGIVTTGDRAAAIDRQDNKLPGGKDLPFDASALPGSPFVGEEPNDGELVPTAQSATILPFSPLTATISEDVGRVSNGSASATLAEAVAAKATSESNSLPGSAEADLTAAASSIDVAVSRGEDLAAPVVNYFGQIQVRIGPALEPGRTGSAGAVASADGTGVQASRNQVAPVSTDFAGKTVSTGDFGGSEAVDASGSRKPAVSHESVAANGLDPKTRPHAVELTGPKLGEVLPSAYAPQARPSEAMAPVSLTQATANTQGPISAAQARTPDAMVANVKVTIAGAGAGDTGGAGEAQHIRRTSLTNQPSEFELRSRASEPAISVASSPRTALDAKIAPIAQAAAAPSALAAEQVLPTVAAAPKGQGAAPDQTKAPTASATKADTAPTTGAVPANPRVRAEQLVARQDGEPMGQPAPVTRVSPRAVVAPTQQQSGQFTQAPQAANSVQPMPAGSTSASTPSVQPTPIAQAAPVPQAAPPVSTPPTTQANQSAQVQTPMSQPSSTEAAGTIGRSETAQSAGGVPTPLAGEPRSALTGALAGPSRSNRNGAGQTDIAAQDQPSVAKPKTTARSAEMPAKAAASKSDLIELNGVAEKAVVAPRTVAGMETAKPLPTAIAAPVDGSFHTARPVSAVTPISTNDPFLNVERVVDQLMTARQLDLSKPTAISVAHREFGALTVTFDQQSTGNMNVEIAAETNEAQRALAAAMANDRGSSRQGEAVAPTTLTQNQAASTPSDRGGMTNGGGSGLSQNSSDDQRSQQSDQRGQSGERGAARHQHQTPSGPDDALYA